MRRSSPKVVLSAGIAAVTAFGPCIALCTDVCHRIQKLAEETVYADAAEHPINATYLGLTERDGDLDKPSRLSLKRDLAQIRAWKRRLAAIPLGRASLAERDDVRLL